MARVATAIARETRSRGIRDVLSPVINIASDVRWGRIEETYGEDPYLTSAMAVAFVKPFEKAGVVTTPKHFVANVGDGGRDSYPIQYSERLLEETYYPPFEAAIHQGGARSVMSAYNSVDGQPATQNRALLTDKLKRDWGIHRLRHLRRGGDRRRDRAASHRGEHGDGDQGRARRGARRDLPVELPTGRAVSRGLQAIDHVGLDDQCRRRSRADGEVRARPVRASIRESRQRRVLERPCRSSRAGPRGGAGKSIVLLKNDRGHPAARRRTRSVAVIGSDAVEARLGGYSGPGQRAGLDSRRHPRQARRVARPLRARSGPRRSRASSRAREPTSSSDSGRTVRGLRGEYFDNPRLEGRPRLVRIDEQVNFGWTLNSPGRGIPFDWYSVRWTGSITVPPSGVAKLGVEGNDGYRLYLDEKLVIDDWQKRSYTTTLADVALAPGSTHDIRLEFFESAGNARVKLVWDAGVDDGWRASIDSAVAIARASDVAIVVAGIEEGEFRDRAKLGLPGHQEELIDAVAATGKPVVVVLVGGSAITMPWLNRSAP